jgi:hypothetical protein
MFEAKEMQHRNLRIGTIPRLSDLRSEQLILPTEVNTVQWKTGEEFSIDEVRTRVFYMSPKAVFVDGRKWR